MTVTTLLVLLAAAALIAASLLLLPRRNRALRDVVDAREHLGDGLSQVKKRRRDDSMVENLLEKLYFSQGIQPRGVGFVVGLPVAAGLLGLVLVLFASQSVGALGFTIMLLGPAVVYLDASRRSARRKKQFAESLPQFLLTVSSGMSAGLTLDQALRELSAGGASVVEEEFQRATKAIAFGETMESALGDMAQRMDSAEIRTLRQATAIGRETGSSLTPILETVAETSLERAQVRREISTLTAEGLMSAYVVIALPFLVFVFLLLSQPDYVSVLWTRPEGVGMAVGAIALISVGWFWLRRLISHETSSL